MGRSSLAALCPLLLLPASCAPSPEPPPSEAVREACGSDPAPGGQIVVGVPSEPQGLNCLRVAGGLEVTLCRYFSGTLLAHDRNLGIIPRLAQSFQSSEDGRSVTFKLRHDVKWHDGVPFTAEDVLYTVERIRSPGSAIRGNLPALFEPLASVEAPDDYTIVASYREPYALAYQAWSRAFIMPAHLPFEPGAATPLSRAPVGTGPFRLVRWEPGVQIVLEAFPDYFGGAPLLDRLIYRIVPDRGSLLAGLRTGDIDIVSFTPTDAPEEDRSQPFRVIRFPANALDFILWNTREDPGLFTDPRVRRALSLALDRPGYIRHLTGGQDLPAVSTFHPSSWAHDPELEPLPHDPGEAAALLAQAGWNDTDGDGILDTPAGPAEFTIIYFSGAAVAESIATMLQESLAGLGVKVHLQGLDRQGIRERVRGRSFQAAVYTWYMDPDPDPYDFFHSSQSEYGQNFGGYSNPEVDRLAEEGRREMEPSRRARLYHQVEKILREEQPYTFLAHPMNTLGVSRRVCGLEFGPAGWSWYPSPLQWWVDPSLPPAGR